MMRIVLFLVTNMAVMLLFGIVMLFINIQGVQIINLLIISFIVGFCGSIASLLMSKYFALLAVNGKLVEEVTTDELEDWLLCTVREQAMKVGVLTPQVAIYDAPDMNAFATGARRDSALVAVSTGLLRNMNRDEIEAVLGHEMSHISSGDMVTITLIQGIINTFVIFISRILAQCFARFVSIGDSDDISEKETFSTNGCCLETNSSVYLFISMILESIFGIFASMITLWFSRHREFYADAGSAKLVGSTKMIAALQKLKLSSSPQESNVVMSFCIHGKVNSMFTELFMSHPPIDKRIQALRYGYYLNKISLFHRK